METQLENRLTFEIYKFLVCKSYTHGYIYGKEISTSQEE